MKNTLLFALPFLFLSCLNSNRTNDDEKLNKEITIDQIDQIDQIDNLSKEEVPKPIEIRVEKDVPIRSYFKWMDSIVAKHNELYEYSINEYDIVHFNNWIIDTLAKTDYYYLMDKGIFNEDPQALIALEKNQVLIIPDSIQTQQLKTRLDNTHLEMNIPEFRLQIIQDGKEIYKFPVRVGKNGGRYLAMAKREVDMRTMPGIGEIVRVNKNPTFINPQNNRRYNKTYRDDGKLTSLPAIPWLEPSIEGRRIGQLIHPTTNLETLEKASSNGCIGLRESDAWIVYYYAPLGTKVIFKYELEGRNEEGENVQFKNIYPEFEN